MTTQIKVKKDHIKTVGRRKRAIARVFFQKGKGVIVVNGKHLDDFYASHLDWNRIVRQPLALLDVAKDFDVVVNVTGGGQTGQAEAIRLGIARALDAWECRTLKIDPNSEEEVDRPWHVALRQAGYLTRDARRVLRKLVGLVGHRKRKQFSKR